MLIEKELNGIQKACEVGMIMVFKKTLTSSECMFPEAGVPKLFHAKDPQTDAHSTKDPHLKSIFPVTLI